MNNVYSRFSQLNSKIAQIDNCVKVFLLNNLNDKILDSMRGDEKLDNQVTYSQTEHENNLNSHSK